MKKFSIGLIAMLAVVLAVSSAFTSKSVENPGWFEYVGSQLPANQASTAPADDYGTTDITSVLNTTCPGDLYLCAAQFEDRDEDIFEEGVDIYRFKDE